MPVVHLMEEDRLRIRLRAVSVDDIPRGGGRAKVGIDDKAHDYPAQLFGRPAPAHPQSPSRARIHQCVDAEMRKRSP